MESTYKVDTIELKKIMIEKNLDKISDLASAANVSRNTLAKIINGAEKPSTTVMEKLMLTLQIPPDRAGLIFFSMNLRKS